MLLDLTGQRFGRLVAVQVASHAPVKWLCRCDCGETTTARSSHLREGATRSCGCGEGLTKHGHGARGSRRSSEYTAWANMLARCERPNHPSYPDYGARGITVCERWHVFENFLADMGPKPGGLTLDRIENDGNYEPGNCRWATYSQQNTNQRPRKRVA